jgi:hypothetical protein
VGSVEVATNSDVVVVVVVVVIIVVGGGGESFVGTKAEAHRMDIAQSAAFRKQIRVILRYVGRGWVESRMPQWQWSVNGAGRAGAVFPVSIPTFALS